MKKLHYFLVCGTIIFHNKDGETGSIVLNALITNDTRNFPARLIGKAQQAVQLHFFKKVPDPTEITVVDVPIQNVCYLGHMSEKEFHATPEGMTVQEKTDNPFADPELPAVDAGSDQVQ